MSVFGRAFTRERRLAPFDPTALALPAPGQGGGLLAASGVRVDSSSALSMMTFFRGVQLIADSIALLPLNVYTRRPDKTFVEVANKPQIAVDPFLGYSLSEGISQLVVSLILRGNGYPYAIESDTKLKPTRVQILSPDVVQVAWDQGSGGRTYKVGRMTLDAANVYQISNFMLPGALMGAGVIEYCRNALGLGLALDEVAGTFFKNGIMSSGIISTDIPLDEDQTKAVADQFVQNHSGVRRAHLPVVLGGGAKYTPISLTPDDAQFIQSRQFAQGEIATLLGIPPHLLGIVDRTTSWGTGIEVQGRAFVDYTLRPYIERLQRVFTQWLPDGMFAQFDTDALTRPDTKTRYEGYQLATQAGLYSPDEIRAMEGKPALPNGGGQTYFMSIQAAPIANQDGSIVQSPPAPTPADDPSTDTPDTTGVTDAGNAQ